MSYLDDYSKDDFARTSWEEYGETLENLYEKVSDYLDRNDLDLDAVVPVERAGNFAGTYLAYKLGVLRVTPIQFKYFFDEDSDEIKLNKLLPFNPKGLDEDANILLVEGDHCFGTTGTIAAKAVKDKLPEATIIYAADHMDYSYQENEFADAVFYGKATNETRELAEQECREKGVETGSHLFPWENLEEEWKTVQAKQFEYSDTEDAAENSETEKVIDNF